MEVWGAGAGAVEVMVTVFLARLTRGLQFGVLAEGLFWGTGAGAVSAAVLGVCDDRA